MRRILFPLLVIGLAGGLFTLGSGAFFSDTESDTGNTITAGTLDLQLGTAAGACDYSNVYPGQDDLATCSVELDMAGNLDNLQLSVELHTAGVADSCTLEFCNATANITAADIIIESCSFGGGACPWTFTPNVTTLGDLVTAACTSLDADADSGEDNRLLSLEFEISSSLGNTAQGDGVTVTFDFGLSQSTDPSDDCHPS